jgi:hypothetical protein
MRMTGKVCFFVMVLAGTTLAQNHVTEPAPAVTGPSYDLSAGYTYLTANVRDAGKLSLNGGIFSGTMALGPRWGAMLETSYLRSDSVFGISHPAYMLDTQAGPEFYPFEHGSTRIFLRALGGAALVDGAIPGDSTAKFFHGWLVRPTYAFGTGFEHAAFGNFGLRISADYLRSSFYDAAGAVQPQNNLRLTASLVFHLKDRHRGSATGLR